MITSLDTYKVRPRKTQILIGMALYLGSILLLIAFFYALLPWLGVNVPDPNTDLDIGITIVIAVLPSIVYILVLAWLYKEQVRITLDLMQIPTIQLLYSNTVKAWFGRQDPGVKGGILLQLGVPETSQQCLVKYSPFQIRVVKALLETCTLKSNEFLVALYPNKDLVLTNRRVLSWDGKKFVEVPFEQVSEYVSTKGGWSKITLVLKTTGGAEMVLKLTAAPLKEQFDYAYQMKDWSGNEPNL